MRCTDQKTKKKQRALQPRRYNLRNGHKTEVLYIRIKEKAISHEKNLARREMTYVIQRIDC